MKQLLINGGIFVDPNWGLLICRGLVLLAAVGVFVQPYFQSKIDLKKDEKINELVKGNTILMTKNEELLSKVEKYQADLRVKDEKIKLLEIESKKTSRGISFLYDFNGARRTTSGPGKISLVVGEETNVFKQMGQLEAEKNFAALITLCEDQIKKTPDWLTPYLVLGVAYANIGEKNKAISNLEYVVENAPGDPAYVKAEEILKKLKAQ